MSTSIRILPDPASLADVAARTVVAAVNGAMARDGRCTLALAGGNTPVGTYRTLAESYRESAPWQEVRFLQGDERMVPPDHEDSNFGMARRELLVPLSLSDEAVLRISGEAGSAEAAAAAYEADLHRLFRAPPHLPPRVDLVLLGLGSDGHTASLMPECRQALFEKEHWVTSCRLERLTHPRVSLTIPVLNAAREVIFLVSGRGKADILHRVLENGDPSDLLPAQRIRPDEGRVQWLVDAAAAGALSTRLRERVAKAGGELTI